MDIIINSLYSDRDVFLRELVSNAADACDKKRFLSITADGDAASTSDFRVRIKPDRVRACVRARVRGYLLAHLQDGGRLCCCDALLCLEGLCGDDVWLLSRQAARTLTIEDTGIGMTKTELVDNLGRIAQSGTKKFAEALAKGDADLNLIGQFGEINGHD
jgi:molecular chaperone HtpG